MFLENTIDQPEEFRYTFVENRGKENTCENNQINIAFHEHVLYK